MVKGKSAKPIKIAPLKPERLGADVPLPYRVAMTICDSIYPTGCGCTRATYRPPCEAMSKAAERVITMIRNEDAPQ